MSPLGLGNTTSCNLVMKTSNHIFNRVFPSSNQSPIDHIHKFILNIELVNLETMNKQDFQRQVDLYSYSIKYTFSLFLKTYPIEITYYDFLKQFHLLNHHKHPKQQSLVANNMERMCRDILHIVRMNPHDVWFGKSSLRISYEVYNNLQQQAKYKKHLLVIKIQSVSRKHIMYSSYQRIRRLVILLQSLIRRKYYYDLFQMYKTNIKKFKSQLVLIQVFSKYLFDSKIQRPIVLLPG